ncbi:zinc ribbon domain-containing protein [Nocardioides jensenii]|uniref:zinc ribbon domain-containing protein n=1 Tax=Nocardioides jensenii TaxID=1843 RepID=UPI0009EA9915|nr:zinc ribbon domain-containing protein [Nocardioides jensenii]
MNFCRQCGAALGPGRFCINCGAPVDQQPTARGNDESAAEKTAVRLPAVQPDASTGTRYPLYPPAGQPSEPTPPPLFADEVTTRAPEQSPASPWVPASSTQTSPRFPAQPQSPAQPPADVGSHRSGQDKRSPLIWLLPLLVALIAAASIGVWLGNRDDGSTDTRGSDDQSQTTGDSTGSTSPSTDPTPTTPTTPSPDADAKDLASEVTASGPPPRRPGKDVNGKKVSYPVTNMFDGSPSTAYRIAGDGTGETITFTLPAESTIKEVGLINGYAKLDPGANWYQRNRKITKVEWLFDDGTSLEQTLRNTTDMQVIGVKDAVTSTIRMRIVSVTEHSGPPLWNVTAVSEVVLRGTTD